MQSDIGALVNTILHGDTQALLPLLDELMYSSEPTRQLQYRRLYVLIGDVIDFHSRQKEVQSSSRCGWGSKWRQRLREIFWSDIVTYSAAITAVNWITESNPVPPSLPGRLLTDAEREAIYTDGTPELMDAARRAGMEAAAQRNRDTLVAFVNPGAMVRSTLRQRSIPYLNAEIERIRGQMEHLYATDRVNTTDAVRLETLLNELESERTRIRDTRAAEIQHIRNGVIGNGLLPRDSED